MIYILSDSQQNKQFAMSTAGATTSTQPALSNKPHELMLPSKQIKM